VPSLFAPLSVRVWSFQISSSSVGLFGALVFEFISLPFLLGWFDVSVPTSMIPCMVIRTRKFYPVRFMESLWRCSDEACGPMVYVWVMKLMIK
jgi:hypothetical protein